MTDAVLKDDKSIDVSFIQPENKLDIFNTEEEFI